MFNSFSSSVSSSKNYQYDYNNIYNQLKVGNFLGLNNSTDKKTIRKVLRKFFDSQRSTFENFNLEQSTDFIAIVRLTSLDYNQAKNVLLDSHSIDLSIIEQIIIDNKNQPKKHTKK